MNFGYIFLFAMVILAVFTTQIDAAKGGKGGGKKGGKGGGKGGKGPNYEKIGVSIQFN